MKIDPTAMERSKAESAKLAIAVSSDGKALFENLHSGKVYSKEKPLSLAGTGAQVYFRSGHIGENDGWILSIPTGLKGRPERQIPIDIEQNPDQVYIWLEKSRERQLELKATGDIYRLIQSGEEIIPDNPIVIGNLAYIFKAEWDKAWHLRVSVGNGAEQDFVITNSTLSTSEVLDQWVLDTIAAVGLNLMAKR
jgi:hypothetical protein